MRRDALSFQRLASHFEIQRAKPRSGPRYLADNDHGMLCGCAGPLADQRIRAPLIERRLFADDRQSCREMPNWHRSNPLRRQPQPGEVC